MNRGLLWRGIFIAVIVGLFAWLALPLDEKIRLGLDLKGGMHMVFQVKTTDALKAETSTDMDRITRLLADEGIPGASGQLAGDQSFELAGIPADKDAAVREALGSYNDVWDWSRNGDKLRFTMNDVQAREVRRMAVAQARQTIDNRVNASKVSEPQISEQVDKERVVVQLPGVDDPERIKRLIQSTAFLEFRLVDFPSSGGGTTREAVLAHYGGQVPPRIEILPMVIRDDKTREVVNTVYLGVEATSVVTGRDLKSARPGLGQFNDPVVNFTFTPEAGQRFGEVTGANVGRSLAIVLDRAVVSAPRINGQIRDSGLIEGNFTQEEARDLVTTLRSGSLPAGLTSVEERTVGPSLGADSIRQGIRAGWIGTLLVILVMLVYYKFSGLNAVLMLVIDAVLVFGALASAGFTLTLPGIAGLVLTVGMAVDANVLIFERIKEEIRRGRTVRAAIDIGFKQAQSSIVDANLTTIIAALFLLQFGTGPIQGFAVTLIIGILASVFTALFVSRWVFDLFQARPGAGEKLSI